MRGSPRDPLVLTGERRLHALEWTRWTRRRLYLDAISDSDDASEHDDTHDSRPTNQRAVTVAITDLLEQAGPERLDLRARVAQAGHRNQGRLTEPKNGPHRQIVELKIFRRDVLAKVARNHTVPAVCKHVEQFACKEMDLTQVRLAGVDSNPGAMLYERPGVSVS